MENAQNARLLHGEYYKYNCLGTSGPVISFSISFLFFTDYLGRFFCQVKRLNLGLDLVRTEQEKRFVCFLLYRTEVLIIIFCD